MPDLIIVFGLARSGTNSVSTYLHLNEDVMMYQGGPDPAVLSDLAGWATWTEKEHLQGLGGPYDTERLQKIYNYVNDKNERFMKNIAGEISRLSYIGQRKNAQLNVATYKQLAEKFKIKFVLCMRRDLEKLIASRLSVHSVISLKHFRAVLLERYEVALQLKSEGFEICAVDVTVAEMAEMDLKRLDRFLGLQPSVYQSWWQTSNPRTNQRQHDRRVISINIAESYLAPLGEMYEKTRSELMT